MDLISELCEIQDIAFSVFEPINLASKKKVLKIHDFLALIHALSNRVGLKAFFEENENKMI